MPDEAQADGQEAQEQQTPAFEEWLEAQDEPTRAMFDEHVHGLKSALDRIKDERKVLKSEIERIQKDKSSDAEQKLQSVSQKLQEAERRATFHESLPPVVTDRRLAWVAAQEYGLVSDDGTCDVDALRSAVPALFTAPPRVPGAGAGTTTPPQEAQKSMNQFIRVSAGV